MILKLNGSTCRQSLMGCFNQVNPMTLFSVHHLTSTSGLCSILRSKVYQEIKNNPEKGKSKQFKAAIILLD